MRQKIGRAATHQGAGDPAEALPAWAATSASGGAIDSDAANRNQIILQDLLTLNAPGPVSMSCSTYDGAAYQVKLTAIKVGAIHG
jgi:hypothetical protein